MERKLSGGNRWRGGVESQMKQLLSSTFTRYHVRVAVGGFEKDCTHSYLSRNALIFRKGKKEKHFTILHNSAIPSRSH